jgi:hypothetical protein
MVSVSFLPHILQFLAQFGATGTKSDASSSHLRECAGLNVADG